MATPDVLKMIKEDPNYKFLSENEHTKNGIDLLTFGGSYAYGTNIEGSDVDVRGCVRNNAREILLGRDFEQVLNETTDTTIYSVKKLVTLLAQCNPNTIEILGCKPEHYFIVSPIGQMLLDNKKVFLSKRCVHTFGGYAISQLRRLENISNKYVDQATREKHILDTIEQARYNFPSMYFPLKDDNSINLFIDDAVNEDYDKEIFMDINLKHYPLRDYTSMWNDMKSIVSSYNRIGKRNKRALDHKKIGKHSMHLVRLYMMCLDILEKQEIITYREKEHDLLMSIRNGAYLNEDMTVNSAFFDLVDEYEKKLQYAAENTELPEVPDMEAVYDILETINLMTVKESL